MADLEFYGSDPGAVKFGNFINYYTFHSPHERIKNLNPLMFSLEKNPTGKTYCCLDIGCNSGELTTELYNFLTTLYPEWPIHILAIDVDPNLIKRAEENSKISNITYLCLDVSDNRARENLEKYLKRFNKSTFDISFCFSVTMWIHLNNGDDGLLSFLQLTKDLSQRVIIEPQPWNCYRNAQRRVKKSGSDFPLYKLLKLRSNVDKEIVEFMDRDNYSKIYDSTCSSWKRKIYSFQRQKENK